MRGINHMMLICSKCKEICKKTHKEKDEPLEISGNCGCEHDWEELYCSKCMSSPSCWNHPAKDCPIECWGCYYGIREGF